MNLFLIELKETPSYYRRHILGMSSLLFQEPCISRPFLLTSNACPGLEAHYKDSYEYYTNEFLSKGCRPELMFQDWECIPSFLISECNLHEDTFKYFEAVLEMDNDRSGLAIFKRTLS